MSTTTTNLHLVKPDLSDAVNIGDLNDNMDTIDTAISGLINTIYPVGSIYMSVASTNPRALFGFGTWERILDTFLLAAGSSYVPGATGGEATHTLTENELPAVSRTINFRKLYNTASNDFLNPISDTGTTESGTYNRVNHPIEFNAAKVSGTIGCATSDNVNITFGNSQPINNMPPYLAVYVWKRVE